MYDPAIIIDNKTMRPTSRGMSWFDNTDRTKRVKEARTEAQREIDEYRKQKEEEFKKFEAEVYGPIYHSDVIC